MEISFQGKTALVTGGLGNLGLHICNYLLKSKISKLVILDKKIDKKIASNIKSQSGQELIFLEADLCNIVNLKDSISDKLQTLPHLDIMINNAAFVGTSDLDGWSVDYFMQSLHAWEKAHFLNLTAVNELIKIAYPYMNNSHNNLTSIINVASIYGSTAPDWSLYQGTGMDNPLAYNTSKAGLIQLTKYLARYFSGKNIRVNSVSPGGIENSQDNKFITKYSERVPLKRMANFEEISKIIVLLSHSDFEYINGQNIIVDGGFTI